MNIIRACKIPHQHKEGQLNPVKRKQLEFWLKSLFILITELKALWWEAQVLIRELVSSCVNHSVQLLHSILYSVRILTEEHYWIGWFSSSWTGLFSRCAWLHSPLEERGGEILKYFSYMFSFIEIKYRDISVRPQTLCQIISTYYSNHFIIRSSRGGQLDDLRVPHVRWQLRQEPHLSSNTAHCLRH